MAVSLCGQQESHFWILILPGFNLCRSTWSILNRFRTGQGRCACAANLYKWHMASTDKCQCNGVQTMNHIVESCPLTKFTDSDLYRLHSMTSLDDCAVTWLQNVAVKAFNHEMKWMTDNRNSTAGEDIAGQDNDGQEMWGLDNDRHIVSSHIR